MGKSKISTEVPEERIGNYLCPICKQETEHRVLTIVHKYDSEDFNGVEVEFWNEYVTTQCNGCKTISFCHKNRCSEELDFDSNGIPLFNYHTKTYPKIENNLENVSFIEESRILEIQSITSVQFNTKKLCQMLLELNQGYKDRSLFSCIFLIRSILDHVPPIFGKSNFNGGSSGDSIHIIDNRFLILICYWTRRGVEVMGNSYPLLDLTVLRTAGMAGGFAETGERKPAIPDHDVHH